MCWFWTGALWLWFLVTYNSWYGTRILQQQKLLGLFVVTINRLSGIVECLTYLRRYWNVDIFISSNTGPLLRNWNLGGCNTRGIVTIRHLINIRGCGGGGNGWRWRGEIIIA